MDQDPSELRSQLEETRARVGDEVDALSYKTDVGARVGDYVGDKKEAVASRLSGAKGVVTKPIPDRAQLQRARYAAERNPLGLAVGAAGVGFAIGLLLPTTRVEDEKLGPASDKVGEVAREGWEHGKQIAQESVEGAMETTKESASRHADELSSSLQDRLSSGEQAGTEPSQRQGQRQPS